nr:NAD-glutamate dehydrogenase [Laribacter sp.]
FAERARLFALPRSSWADYNPELISAGGGVFPRSAKSIELSPQVRAWLKTERDSMAPLELIHAILKAEADLLYNGGIGTYIKASTETHADARDRANDGLRVDGCDLNVRVVGEGGNLGCTQRGRIEFARKGGLICTDAIDNSAGVDCSDHEVNIKILLGSVIQSGDMTLKQRNDLLAEMTDEVGQLVLRNNYLQTEILAVNRANAMNMLNAQQRMISHLEKTGELNRQIEFLPSDDEINERRLAKCGLTTPEVAVLLAYSKISLDKALLASDLPDDTDFTPVLVDYFPHPLQSRFGEAMKSHHLRREIIANQLANRVVNRMGATFVFRMQEETSLPADVICRAFWAADRIFGAETVWREIEALDNVVPADLQVELMVELRTLLERAVRWLLRNRKGHAGVSEAVALYQDAARTLLASLPELVPSHLYTRAAARQLAWIEDSVPERLAMMLARLEYVPAFFDVTELSRKTGIELTVAARAYYMLGRELDLDWLAQAITRLPRDNRWQSLARTALRDDLYRLHGDLATAALGCPTCDVADYVTPWLAERDAALVAVRQTLAELRGYAQLDLAMLSAGMREIANQLMN